ncbi:MAG: sigma-70 family RNA polymerase sigma factor [Clostridia bacterium]|nr:sigma-70 family RNA polymerase sigma factor [Clostridia bacterium]
MDSIQLKGSGGLSDEELVKLIQSGKDEYFSVLFKRHIGLIKYIVGNNSSGDETEDALSEGFLSFFKAVKLYAPEKGASFKTFFTITVQSDIWDFNKKKKSKRRIPGDMLTSIEEAQPLDHNSPESLLLRKESVRDFFDTAKSKLSDFEYAVFCDRCFGRSYAEIAARTGRSEKAVSAALARTKNKLSNKG